MKISTKFFEEVEIDENLIINFENGIPGFEDLKEYVVLDIEDRNFKCLQSVKEKDICLLIISPWDYFKDYEINLSNNETNELEIKDEKEVMVYNIITVREGKITVNLVAPIVINILNNKAKQIVLSNSKYSIREGIECLY